MPVNQWRASFSSLMRSMRSATKAAVEAPSNSDAPAAFPAGHFYSPIASLSEIQRREGRIFGAPSSFGGIDLNEEGQRAMVAGLSSHFSQEALPENKEAGLRFYYNNPNFGRGEALIYSSMLSYLRPKHVIEIGSGFSTLLLLDTLDRIGATETACVCIEPHPDLLDSLLPPEDRGRVEINRCQVQDADLTWFDALEEDDVLFIDSTHVSKTGSDVNFELFEILPRLHSGGYVHFHDVYFPFEYPRAWVYQGRNWNEVYLIRAFLQYNREFRIVCFNSYLGAMHPELFEQSDPMFLKHHGSSLWLRRE